MMKQHKLLQWTTLVAIISGFTIGRFDLKWYFAIPTLVFIVIISHVVDMRIPKAKGEHKRS
jgi:hypothetical protein